MHNDWVFSDVDFARLWRERAKDKLLQAEKEAEEAARRELWEPVVEAAVLAVTDDDWILQLIDEQIEQAAIEILVAKVANFQEREKLKREAREAQKADEAKRAKARDELKKKRDQERKDRDRKEKEELAAVKKELLSNRYIKH